MILHFYCGVGTPKSSKGLEAQGLKAKGDDVIEAGFVVSRKRTRGKATMAWYRVFETSLGRRLSSVKMDTL